MHQFLLSLLLFVLVAASPAQAQQRPNILFAFADDWGRYASVYGQLEPGTVNDIIKTPNFDRIAKQGVLFTNAFVSSPSCTPCRSSIFSGQHFWRTGLGAILQGAVWDDSIPSYPLILKETGYHIGFTYKAWSPGIPRDAPYGGDAHRYESAGNAFNKYSQRATKAADSKAMRGKLDQEVRRNFQSFLNAREADQPFCYFFGPTNTHRKWANGSAQTLWGLNPDDLIGKLPASMPDAPVVRQDFADYLGETMAFDTALGVLMQELEATGELENTLIVVSGDHGIPGFPNGKCNLYDLGSHVALAIAWGNKIKPGRVINDFVTLPDLAPTFLEAGGVPTPNVMTAKSLIPILTSEASGKIDPTRDHVIIGRERHIAKARTGNLPYPQRAIRTDQFLYIRNFAPDRYPHGIGPHAGTNDPMPTTKILTGNTFIAYSDMDASPTKAFIATHRNDNEQSRQYFQIAFGLRPAEELYDLTKDPQQLINVASESTYASIKAALVKRLQKTLKETNDPRVFKNKPTIDFERSPFTDPVKKK